MWVAVNGVVVRVVGLLGHDLAAGDGVRCRCVGMPAARSCTNQRRLNTWQAGVWCRCCVLDAQLVAVVVALAGFASLLVIAMGQLSERQNLGNVRWGGVGQLLCIYLKKKRVCRNLNLQLYRTDVLCGHRSHILLSWIDDSRLSIG